MEYVGHQSPCDSFLHSAQQFVGSLAENSSLHEAALDGITAILFHTSPYP